MIIIYDMENTKFYETIDMAKDKLADVYGAKLGSEAYAYLKDAPVGTTYRKYGGPLIKIVNMSEAEWILNKEKEIGMV